MASSYTKICDSFAKSSEWKELAADFRANLANACIDRYEFQDYNPEEEKIDERIRPYFFLKLGGIEARYGSGFFTNGASGALYPNGDLLRPVDLNEIPIKLFGANGYPTYFCKRETLLEGDKKGNVTTWADFARKKLLDDNKPALEAYEARIRAQYNAIWVSDEFRNDKIRFYHRQVITEIRNVVLKYHAKVGSEVLKEALDEVVTHAIMES